MRISLQYKKIKQKIDLYAAKLKELQELCPHENKTETPGANTGNYDPSDNCYWTTFKCNDCGKIWTQYYD